ncbi:unnamed protein product [Prunus armeniaca]
MVTICGTDEVGGCAVEVEELCGRTREASGVVIAMEIDGVEGFTGLARKQNKLGNKVLIVQELVNYTN